MRVWNNLNNDTLDVLDELARGIHGVRNGVDSPTLRDDDEECGWQNWASETSGERRLSEQLRLMIPQLLLSIKYQLAIFCQLPYSFESLIITNISTPDPSKLALVTPYYHFMSLLRPLHTPPSNPSHMVSSILKGKII